VAGTRVCRRPGMRRGRRLAGRLRRAVAQIDLDSAEFFEESDLAAYAEATLQLVGDERPGTRTRPDGAGRWRPRSLRNPGETSCRRTDRTGRMGCTTRFPPPAPAGLSFSGRVGAAMREYLRPRPAGQRWFSAEEALTALAFQRHQGCPPRCGGQRCGAGDRDVSEEALTRFARSPAAGFLIEAFSEDDQGATFCLSHQALSDALLQARARAADPAADERALARAFLAAGQQTGWRMPPATCCAAARTRFRAGWPMTCCRQCLHDPCRPSAVGSALDEVSSTAGHAAPSPTPDPLGRPAGPGERAHSSALPRPWKGSVTRALCGHIPRGIVDSHLSERGHHSGSQV